MWVIDTESDDLADNATKLWVAVCKAVETGEMKTFVDPGDDFIQLLEEADFVIMHNAIDHDWRVIRNILGYEIPKEKIIDTLVLSRFNWPDRPGPHGKFFARPHSVEAWGERFGIPKPEHEDWSRYSEEMRHRCEQDTEIQFKMFEYLIKEFEELYHK